MERKAERKAERSATPRRPAVADARYRPGGLTGDVRGCLSAGSEAGQIASPSSLCAPQPAPRPGGAGLSRRPAPLRPAPGGPRGAEAPAAAPLRLSRCPARAITEQKGPAPGQERDERRRPSAAAQRQRRAPRTAPGARSWVPEGSGMRGCGRLARRFEVCLILGLS